MRHASITRTRRLVQRVTGNRRRGFAGLALAGFAAGIPMVITVHSGDTLSGIAAQHDTTYQAIAQANNISNPDLIYTGQRFTIPSGGSGSAYTPSPVTHHHHHHSSSTSSGGSGYSSSGSLSDVPGVPQSFAACVAYRESSNNPRSINSVPGFEGMGGGAYGIMDYVWQGSDLNKSGQPYNASLSEQKQAFSILYAKYGTSPWQPSDGCTG